jgi:tetratricopeptide (TPR) repeat protein
MANFDQYFSRGEEALKRGNTDYAIQLFAQLLGLSPNHEKGREMLLVALTQKHGDKKGGMMTGMKVAKSKMTRDKEKKVVELDKLWVEDYRHEGLLLELGTALFDAEHFGGARIILDFLVSKVNGANHDAVKKLGHALFRMQRIHDAINTFDRANKIKSDKECTDMLRNLAAQSALVGDQTKGGKGGWNEMLKEGADFKQIAKDIDKQQAQQLAKSGFKTQDAVASEVLEAKRGVQASPEDYKAWRELARAAEAGGDLKLAIEALKKWAELDPRTASDANNKIGDLTLKQIDQNIAKIREALKVGKSNEAQLEEWEAKRLQYAITEWERRVLEHPTDAELKFVLGEYYLEAGRSKDAVGCFQQAQKDARYLVRARVNLGNAFRMEKKAELAIKQYEKALEFCEDRGVNETTKPIIYAIGDTYDRDLKDKTNGSEWFMKIYEEDIGYKDVAERV